MIRAARAAAPIGAAAVLLLVAGQALAQGDPAEGFDRLIRDDVVLFVRTARAANIRAD